MEKIYLYAFLLKDIDCWFFSGKLYREMRIVIGIIVVFTWLVSCQGKKQHVDPFEALTTIVDSTKMVVVDTLPVLPEEPVAIKADEIFDDFILSFATDVKMQRARIDFPLSYYNDNTPQKITEEEWNFDSFFIGQGYYTLLFDDESDMDMVQDTSLSSVQFEWIEMKTKYISKYYFDRKNGAWILEAINRHSIETDENEDFVSFFYRFATDSVFQMQRIASSLIFVTNDPEDDFSIMEAVMEKEQWPAFRPVLPIERLTNINYGQRNQSGSSTKVLSVKWLDNGVSNTFYFRRRGNGDWILYKFEDLMN